MQPVNIIPPVSNSVDKKHYSDQDDFVTYEDFASMLAKKEKKTVKKVTVKEVKETKQAKETEENPAQIAMARMKYYDHDAKEIYFYTTNATTDIKG